MSQNVDQDEGIKKLIEEKEQRELAYKEMAKRDSCIVFYCRDCRRLVPTTRMGKRYIFPCDHCQSKRVAFGTEASVRKFFHVPEEEGLQTPEEYEVAAKERAERRKERDERRKAKAA